MFHVEQFGRSAGAVPRGTLWWGWWPGEVPMGLGARARSRAWRRFVAGTRAGEPSEIVHCTVFNSILQL